MPFILESNKLFKLAANLRKEYQAMKRVDLEAPQSFFGWPYALGGVNVPERRKHIELIEKMLHILKPNIFKEEEISTNEELEAHLTSVRTMIGIILYIMSQTGRSSVLYSLLKDALGIVPDSNYLDEEDQELCFLAAKRVISSESFLERANKALRDAGIQPISEKEWAKLKNFLMTKSSKILVTDPYANYPITNVTQKLFSAAGAYTGATVGMLGGDVLSQSSQSLSPRMQLTTLVGGTLIVFHTAGPAGVALFAPAIAQRFISALCSISLAHILGTSMGIIGQGIGIGVGMPLDITYMLLYRLLYATCSTINSYVSPSSKPQISGIRIKDGVTVVFGIAIEATSSESISVMYQQAHVKIEDGELYINDKRIEVPDTGIKLPKETVALLRSKLGISAAIADKDEADVSSEEEGLEQIDAEPKAILA